MRAVIRSPAFQRPMRALALMAVLLLALVPSASRLLASRAAADAHAGWAELCTVAGLKLVKLAPAAPQAPGDPAAAHGHDGDCAYCPLLASLGTPIATPVLLLALLPPATAPVLQASERPTEPRTHGLGSRGPPLAA
jgi:hypothetical protein